jgi:hypothetical protein
MGERLKGRAEGTIKERLLDGPFLIKTEFLKKRSMLATSSEITNSFNINGDGRRVS